MYLFGRGNLAEDWRMKFCCSIVLLLTLQATSYARTAHHNSRVSVDPAYSSALAAANRFLHAWQNEDHETGIVMLADSARQNLSQDSLQTFFSPGPDAAYEIAHGQRLKAGEYAFPLVLFGSSEGKSPRYCKLVVIRDGKSDWAVEKLP
jgi:hypothetical protein